MTNFPVSELYNRLHVNRRLTLRCVDFVVFDSAKRALSRKHWQLNGLTGRNYTLTSNYNEEDQKATFTLVPYDPPTFEVIEETDDGTDVCRPMEEDSQERDSSTDLSSDESTDPDTRYLYGEVTEQDS